MTAVFTTPMTLKGVSVVNRVSSLSDEAAPGGGRDRFCTSPLTMAGKPKPWGVPATTLFLNDQVHTWSPSTPLTRASTVIYNPTAKQPKTYKALYQCVKTNCHTRTFITLSMTVIFTMVIKYWSIPHNLFSWLRVPNPTSGPHTHTCGHNTPVLYSWAFL